MQTFHKKERLCNRTDIEHLFSEGKKIHISPFVVLWQRPECPGNSRLKLLISVSKRNFPHAVDRNAIKRLVREAFRLNKQEFINYLESTHQQCEFCVIYTGSGKDSFTLMESKILLILQRLQKAYEKTVDQTSDSADRLL